MNGPDGHDAAFTINMTPRQAARATAALDRAVMNGGRCISRRALVKEKLAAGYAVRILRSGERALVSPDGAYITESQVSKTAMDYAEWMGLREDTHTDFGGGLGALCGARNATFASPSTCPRCDEARERIERDGP